MASRTFKLKTIPISEGGTGATNEHGALNNLWGTQKITSTIAKGTTATFTFADNVVGLLIISGNSSTQIGLYLLGVSTQASRCDPVLATNVVTISTPSNGVLTIENNTGITLRYGFISITGLLQYVSREDS